MGRKSGSASQVNKLTIVIVGEGGVGKSSITLQYISHDFLQGYDPTIDDSYITTVVVDQVPWQIEILDTAGQEEYRGLWVEHAISQGDAYIITYAINGKNSFSEVTSLLEQISNAKGNAPQLRHKVKFRAIDDMKPKHYPFPFSIAANKCDLEAARNIPSCAGMQLANACGGLFFETSAKENINIQEMFTELIRSVSNLRQKEQAASRDPMQRYDHFIPNIGYQLSRSAPLNPLKIRSDQSLVLSPIIPATPTTYPPQGPLPEEERTDKRLSCICLIN